MIKKRSTSNIKRNGFVFEKWNWGNQRSVPVFQRALLTLLILLLATFEVRWSFECARYANWEITSALEGNQYHVQLWCLITRIMNVTGIRSAQLGNVIRYNKIRSSKMWQWFQLLHQREKKEGKWVASWM